MNHTSIQTQDSNTQVVLYQLFTKIKKINFKKKDTHRFLNHKNIYIPAERNFVSVIPNLGRYKETNDNILNFIYDWYEAKKHYSKVNKLDLLNLGLSYHNIEGDDLDKIVLENKKELNLSSASSGIQSVTPLLILFNYLSKGIYDKKILSPEEKKLEKEFINPIKNIKDGLNSLKENSLSKEVQNLQKKLLKLENDAGEYVNRLVNYHFTQFIIEELEQNLFPTTQRDLLYFIISKVNNVQKEHTMLITTHSPYILYSLNNCLMGFNVQKSMPQEEQSELKSHKSWIDPKLVSIWEIDTTTGSLKDVKNKETGTVSKHYFNKATNEIMDEYYNMLDYFE